MNIITLDFETFFDSGAEGYTLKKMTTEAYIRDERFWAHGAAIRWPDGTAKWYTENTGELAGVLVGGIDWTETAILAHHAHFDGLILSHHYGIKPKFWFDTLSMARMLLGNHLGVGLDALAKHFGLGAKTVPYSWFDGRHWDQLPVDVRQAVAEGCCDDVDLTWRLFQLLAKDFPRSEYELVDMTVRMFTEPKLVGDIQVLTDVWTEERDRKQDLLEDLNVTADELQSAEKFQALLEAEGVEIEYKQGTNGLIPAFGKNDTFMKELLENDDGRVGGLVAARLGVKSTGLQSRAETLGWMSRRGPLCVYLRYSGANTTRWAGGDRSNFQNLKRGHKIRTALCVPDGYLFASPDASQIECRLLNFIAGQWDVVEKFRRGEDIYCDLASKFYGERIYKPASDDPRKDELEAKRGTGKQGELSCGYGCGGAKFKRTAALGIYGPPVRLSDEEAQQFVYLYRNTHPAVVALWRQAEQILSYLQSGAETQWGPVLVKNHRIWLPNGAPLIYDTLEVDTETNEWRIKQRRGWQKMYGAKLVENLIQALARVHIGECMIKIKHVGLSIVGMSHDEPWVLIPDNDDQEQKLNFCLDVLSSSPTWLPDVPLAAEAPPLGKRYGK